MEQAEKIPAVARQIGNARGFSNVLMLDFIQVPDAASLDITQVILHFSFLVQVKKVEKYLNYIF